MNVEVPSTVGFIASRLAGDDVTGSIPAANGQATLSIPDNSWAVALMVDPTSYNKDLVRINKSGSNGVWLTDNPVATLAVDASGVTVALVVGHLRSAPTQYIPDEDLSKLAGPPHGVLLTKTSGGMAYHSLFQSVYRPFMRLDHPALAPKLPEGARLWERLRATPVAVVDPAKSGSFFHLEYGDPATGPRLFLSVYLPSAATRKKLDIAVFFSPSTAIDGRFPVDGFPFRKNYPYGLAKFPTPTSASQEYPRLAQAYLFNGTFLAYQLLAAGSSAALVMPLAPYGANWFAFQTKSGLHRFAKELALFLHREMLTTAVKVPRPVSAFNSQAGGSVRDLTGLGVGVGASVFAAWGATPQLGRVAISGFSSGVIALQALLTDASGGLPEGFDTNHFGGSTSDFEKVFAEIWDIDGAHAKYHGYPAFEKALAAWMAAGNRRFRLYHSEYTGGSRDSMAQIDLAPLTKRSDIQNDPTVKESGATLWAHERFAESKDWTAMRFANGFLSSADPGPAYPFWKNDDPHHFLPTIAFGHAALLFSELESR